MPVILMGMMFLSCHRTHSLDPEDGLKSLKALNSDLINLGDKVNDNEAFTILRFLLNEPSSPLAYHQGLIDQWINDTLTGIGRYGGTFHVTGDTFVKVAESNMIEIIRDDTLMPYAFTLTAFSCERIMSGFNFPVEVLSGITSGEKEVLLIREKATLADQMPEHFECIIKGDDFNAQIEAHRTREDNSGKMDSKIRIKAKGYEIISGSLSADLGYNDKLVYFRSFEPDICLFDVRIKGRLDYSKVDPTSKDYVKSFNDHCKIGFYEESSGKKIGDFGIGYLPDGERLGWMLYLSDGTPVLLEEQLLFAEKILNYKYPNRVTD